MRQRPDKLSRRTAGPEGHEQLGVLLAHLRLQWLLNHFSPLAETSSPRNAILGHAIGLVCGYAAFLLAISSSPPFAMYAGVHGPRVLAAGISLSATGALMVLFCVSHPPAGATPLIASLGIISRPKELVIVEIAVFLLTLRTLAINRLAGVAFPIWRYRQTPAGLLRQAFIVAARACVRSFRMVNVFQVPSSLLLLARPR